MPNYNMSTLVVGGIGKHAFYIIDSNDLITPANNRGFELSLGDWGYSGSSVISRVADEDTQFGSYCMKIVDNDASNEEYAQWIHSLSSGTIASKMYIVYFWAKSNVVMDGNVQLYSNDSISAEIGNNNIGLTENWKPYYCVFFASNSADATILYLRFKPYSSGAGVSGVGTMYVDNIHFYEISEAYKLDQATEFNQEWIKNNSAEYLIANKDRKIYQEGSLYSSELIWDFLEPPEEYVKNKIYTAKKILFVPHMDYNWAILVTSNGNDERRYFKNKYIGHVGHIELKGLEMIISDPPEIPFGTGAGDNNGSGKLSLGDVTINNDGNIPNSELIWGESEMYIDE